MTHDFIFQFNTDLIDEVVDSVAEYLTDLDSTELSSRDKFILSRRCLQQIVPLFTRFFDECRKEFF